MPGKKLQNRSKISKGSIHGKREIEQSKSDMNHLFIIQKKNVIEILIWH